MQPAGIEGDAQRPARREQLRLADHVVQALRPQPLGKRGAGARCSVRRRGIRRGIEQRLLARL